MAFPCLFSHCTHSFPYWEVFLLLMCSGQKWFPTLLLCYRLILPVSGHKLCYCQHSEATLQSILFRAVATQLVLAPTYHPWIGWQLKWNNKVISFKSSASDGNKNNSFLWVIKPDLFLWPHFRLCLWFTYLICKDFLLLITLSRNWGKQQTLLFGSHLQHLPLSTEQCIS